MTGSSISLTIQSSQKWKGTSWMKRKVYFNCDSPCFSPCVVFRAGLTDMWLDWNVEISPEHEASSNWIPVPGRNYDSFEYWGISNPSKELLGKEGLQEIPVLLVSVDIGSEGGWMYYSMQWSPFCWLWQALAQIHHTPQHSMCCSY